MKKPTIVAKPQDITPDYLTQILQHAGIDASVASFTAGNVGTGQVGQNVRFELTYNTPAPRDAPQTIVGKFTSEDPVSRQTGVALLNYLREVKFYNELRETLDVQTPKLLFTDINEDTHDFVLMMEDLAPAEQGNQLEGCSVAEVKTGLTEMAKLHGPRWGDKTLYDLEWLGRPDPEADATVTGLYTQLFPGFIERYGDRLSKEQKTMGQRLGEQFSSYVAKSQGAQNPMTVVHGDYRLDNMMFGGPYPVAVVDWQSPVIGNAGQDLAYWVGTSLDPTVRKAHDRELVEHYFSALSNYAIGSYSLEQCWDDYCHFSFAGWNMAVIASMIVGQTDRGDDMFMAMATRSAQMALDLNALDTLNSV